MASSLSPFLRELTERASPSGTFQGTPPAVLPAENGVHVWRAAIATPFFTCFFVGLRLYTRTHIVRRKLTFDDYVAVLTMLVCIAHAGLMAHATKNGMGLHIWQFDADLNARYYLWIGITSEFYVLGLCGFKCALILQYLQLFGVDTRFRWACYWLLFFCVGYLSCNMITEFFGCSPIAKKWQPNLPGHCINSVVTNSFYGACSMASDLAIAILPLTMIWRLQFQSRRQKIGLSLVLSCGFVAWAVAVARWGIATYNMLSNDRPWWAGISFTLSIVEINTGLICACVATLGPLWKLASASVKGRSTRRDSEASTWPASFHKYRLSGLLHKNKTPSRHSQVQKQGYENVARNEALISPPMRAQRGDAMYYSGDDEYILLDYSGARGSNSAEDPSWRERIV